MNKLIQTTIISALTLGSFALTMPSKASAFTSDINKNSSESISEQLVANSGYYCEVYYDGSWACVYY